MKFVSISILLKAGRLIYKGNNANFCERSNKCLALFSNMQLLLKYCACFPSRKNSIANFRQNSCFVARGDGTA